MNLSELQAIVSRGEDAQHQFKADVTNINSLAAEMVAFSNSQGGMILIGVHDNGLIWIKNGADKRKVTAREEIQLLVSFASGIMRALNAYPDIEFIDDRENNLFKAIIKRPPFPDTTY